MVMPEIAAEQLKAAWNLAQAFDRWKRLNDDVQRHPGHSSVEQLDAVWRAVLEAHERFSNAR